MRLLGLPAGRKSSCDRQRLLPMGPSGLPHHYVILSCGCLVACLPVALWPAVALLGCASDFQGNIMGLRDRQEGCFCGTAPGVWWRRRGKAPWRRTAPFPPPPPLAEYHSPLIHHLSPGSRPYVTLEFLGWTLSWTHWPDVGGIAFSPVSAS